MNCAIFLCYIPASTISDYLYLLLVTQDPQLVENCDAVTSCDVTWDRTLHFFQFFFIFSDWIRIFGDCVFEWLMVATISNEKNVRNQVLTLLDKVTGFGLIMLTTTLFFVFQHAYYASFMKSEIHRRQRYVA